MTAGVRLVHTSDWHIGKTFGFTEDASQVLRDERLEVINRVGALAQACGAVAVLVAGDVYDMEMPNERTLRQPIERMRAFPDIAWHIIPGNHDAHSLRGPWHRLRDLPANVMVHLTPAPVPIGHGEAWILPAVLTRRHEADDPTAPMAEMATPAGALRIGLAHGSVADFGSDTTAVHNRIALDRAAAVGLAYLALGDGHGSKQVGDCSWYSGTPEPDGFDVGGAGGGEALVVEFGGAGGAVAVTRRRVGRFAWQRVSATLHGTGDIAVLEARLRGLTSDLGSALVWLRVDGALSLADRTAFEDRIRHGVGSALRVLRIDDAGLLPKPTAADLEAIDHAGFVRAAAETLAARAADPADPAQGDAAAALQRLFVLQAAIAR